MTRYARPLAKIAVMVGAVALLGCASPDTVTPEEDTAQGTVTVSTPDGTVTENRVATDGTVTGVDGETFAFGEGGSEVTPVPECSEGYALAEDLSCVPLGYWDTPASPVMEDSPEWDCRTMGNETCGVEIQGTWYLVTFQDGAPVAIR